MAVSSLGKGREFDLIRAFLANARSKVSDSIQLGPGDDCVIVDGLAISTDMSVENIHFRRDWLTPDEIGYRAATAALSDLAAVAAEPVGALVSFAFSQQDAQGWATEVMRGATTAIETCGAALIGGDVARSPGEAVIDVTVIGRAHHPILRSTAQIGDEVWVTGTLGGAAAAVEQWLSQNVPAPSVRARFARPAARTREAIWLREHAKVHALIDLSDGIAGDAGHIAAASECSVVIDAAALPVHAGATLQQALQGGEDYELCITSAAGSLAAVADDFTGRFGLELTRVGYVETGGGVRLLNAESTAGGFDHFRGKTTQP